MSTLAYAVLTRKREEAKSGSSTSTNSPGVSAWVDSLASLVPSEILAAHGALLAVTTTTDNMTGKAITTITDAATLTAVFYALIGVSILLLVGARLVAHAWDRLHYARITRFALSGLQSHADRRKSLCQSVVDVPRDPGTLLGNRAGKLIPAGFGMHMVQLECEREMSAQGSEPVELCAR